MDHICFMRTPHGEVLRIRDDGVYLKEVSFAEHACGCCLNAVESEIGRETKRQLAEYFDGKRREFDLPILLDGTEFHKKVWNVLREIPYGSTLSYKETAAAAGSPKGARAAGQANHVNPIVIIVPCHRVICSNGSLGGYAGGLAFKEYLLQIEGITVKK